MSDEIICVGPLGQLAKALAKAQLEMRDAKKDAVNPHFKNKYATLASVREAVTEPLAKHGLCVLQAFEPHGEAGVCIVTVLMHESGGSVTSRLFLPCQKKDAQGFGSAITYGRRYSLAAICGIASDDDDDANAATGKAAEAKAESKADAEAARSKAETDLARVFDECKDTTALAAAEMAVVAAVRDGVVDSGGATRLRAKRKETIARLENGTS